MIRSYIISLSLASMIVHGQAIPPRPEQLVFKPVTFKVPDVRKSRVKLSNGISTYLVTDNTSQPIVNFQITVRGGGYLDPIGKEGLAQIMGSLMRTGGTRSKTPAELDDKIEFMAAQAGSNFGDERGNLSMSVLTKDAKDGLLLLKEMLTEPRFNAEQFELIKKNILQGMQRRNDDTTSIERQQLGFLLRGEDYYGNRNITKASLDAISLDDVRSAHAQMFHPSNLIVSVSGRFDRAMILTLLNENLGTLKAAELSKVSPDVPYGAYLGAPGIYVVNKDVNQGRVTVNLPGVAALSEDYPSVLVMNTILGGGGFTSRLVKKIRSDEGLAYSAGSTFTGSTYVNREGDFRALFQSKTRTVAYGIRLTLAEMEKMRTAMVTPDELNVAKGAIIDGFPASFASTSAVASNFATGEFSKRPDEWLETLRDRVKKVTREDVLRAAKKYLALDKASILVIGNAKEIEEGDVKDHPGKLSEVGQAYGIKWNVVNLPLRDPMSMKAIQ